MEPPILELFTAAILERDKLWTVERVPAVKDRVRNRLGQLSTRLDIAEWLDSAFSAGDLITWCRYCSGRGHRACWTNIRIWPPMWPAAKRDPPTNVPSLRNWR